MISYYWGLSTNHHPIILENIDNLWDLINEASNAGYSHILLMGDFNLPDIDWDTWSCKGDVHRT